MSNRRIIGPPGTTLIESLIAVVIIGIVAAAVTQGVGAYLRELRGEELKAVAMDLAVRLREEAANPDNISISAIQPGNAVLLSCVKDSGNCQAMNSSEGVNPPNHAGFSLYRARKTAGAATTIERLAGPATNPVFYSTKGQICAAASSSCFIRAEAYFWATCPLSAARVPQPACPNRTQAINVRYRVYVDPTDANVPSFYASAKVISNPPAAAFNADTMAFSVRVASGFDQCPVGSVLRGFDLQGRVICRCVGSNQDISATQQCPAVCNAGEYVQSFDANGVAVCKSLTPACRALVSTTSGSFSCGVGYHIRQVRYDGCEAKLEKKAPQWPIDCAFSIECCPDLGV